MSGSAFTSLAEIQPEPVQWLWEGRIPRGKLTLLEGEPGVGKSSLTLELAARVSRGSPMPLVKTHSEPANVVIFSADDGLADTVRPRLDAAGADLTRIFAIDGLIDEAELIQLRPALVIIDPLDGYIELSEGLDPVEVLRKLGDLAEASGAAILAIHCLNEGMHDDKAHAFHGTPRTVLHLTPIGHGGRRLALAKSNLRHFPDVHPLVYYIDDQAGQPRIVNWADGR